MRFITDKSFKDKTLGSNIESVTQTFNDAEAIFNSTNNNTAYYDRAEIELGLLKNKDFSENAIAPNDSNTLSIAFQVVLEDNNFVTNYSNYKIGIGVKGSEHMIWISQLTFIADISLTRRPRLLIETYSNASDSLVQG